MEASTKTAPFRLATGFEYGGQIPARFCNTGFPGGRNISIPVTWDQRPPGTKSMALIMVDVQPGFDNYVHWLVVDIPPETENLPEGVSGTRFMSEDGMEEFNSSGSRGYEGPQPPAGSGPHEYVLTVYALSEEHLPAGRDTGLNAFIKMIEGKVIASSSIKGFAGR